MAGNPEQRDQKIMGDPKMKFLRLFLSAVCRMPIRPNHKKLFLTLSMSDVRPGANTVGSILYDIYTLGQNTLGQNALGQNTLGQIYVKRSFLWSVGPSVGGESDGKGHWRTADGRKFLLLFRTAQK